MADCKLLSTCPFFNNQTVSDSPEVVEVLKKRFCRGDNSGCARFMIFQRLGREKVPENLFPNNTDWAERILRDAAA